MIASIIIMYKSQQNKTNERFSLLPQNICLEERSVGWQWLLPDEELPIIIWWERLRWSSPESRSLEAWLLERRLSSPENLLLLGRALTQWSLVTSLQQMISCCLQRVRQPSFLDDDVFVVAGVELVVFLDNRCPVSRDATFYPHVLLQ